MKHAKATEVTLQLLGSEKMLSLILEDNGIGMAKDLKASRNGIGLQNIKNRISYLNGSLDIFSESNNGTTFTVHVPVLLNNTK